jgi:sugar O-acyltransferase (sialic acid O-acetyltransferase NeuD family)
VSGKIILLGYSGHGYVVADAAIAAGMPLNYYAERRINALNPFKLEYLGKETDEEFPGWIGENQFLLGIGDNTIRNKVALNILSNQQVLSNVLHPSASISSYFQLGIGNFISRQVSVNALARIGNFCILNTGCIVEHECEIGNSVHIAPGAVLAGQVKVGDLSFIGANVVVKQGITIGSNVVIGAGAVIIKDVPDDTKIVGNPGRVL